MVLKNCTFCKNKVPVGGQCNKCGFIDGLSRKPADEEYAKAREMNKRNNYKQFVNLDMLLLDD
ncbi:MAG: hypothetical protein V1837_00330 [Candidatus Woesearchaeota archaeon]